MVRKQKIFILIVLWLFAFSATGWVSATSEPLRHALVIGNGDYKAGPLKNPVNDSRDMRDLLRNIGFEVIHLENAGQRRMEDAIRTFGANLRRGGGEGFFYYAGHGMQVGGHNYLIPVGARIVSEHEMKYAAVDLGRVLDEVSRAENRANIIILDACRDNPFARSFRSSAKGLAKVGDTPTGTLIFYATSPGNTALDGEGRNSPYTKALLKHLPTPGKSILDICTRVNKDVKEATNKQQQPWMASSLTESVILVAGGSAFYTIPAENDATSAPTTGSLLVKTRPSGAAVSVAGVSRGRSPLTLENLDPGRFEVKTVLSGYEPASRTVLIQTGHQSRLTLLLDKIVTSGSLKISSDPVGAEWYLDGAYVGLTPDSLSDIEKGSHTVLVQKSGFRDWSQRASIEPGREMELVATLKKISPAKMQTTYSRPEAGTLSQGSPGDSFTGPVTGMEFVWVEGGCFQMGQSQAEKDQLIKADKEWYEKYAGDELPRHRVCVDGFWMAKHEVTVGQWRRFIKADGYKTDAERDAGGKKGSYVFHKKDDDKWGWGWVDDRDWDNPGFAQSESQPVCCVSYNDVTKFITWLNRKSSRSLRLPTEAEWEYACRAGSSASRFWGDDADQACAYANVADQTRSPEGVVFNNKHECKDGYFYPAPVGEFKSNDFGLYDMLGNVWEWCSDWYAEDYFKSSPVQNPQGPDTGSYRVSRGGSWDYYPQNVRSAYRNRGRPSYRYNYLGFRLVSPGR